MKDLDPQVIADAIADSSCEVLPFNHFFARPMAVNTPIFYKTITTVALIQTDAYDKFAFFATPNRYRWGWCLLLIGVPD